jgi:aspartokinase/homoserine dehydrogenase 1
MSSSTQTLAAPFEQPTSTEARSTRATTFRVMKFGGTSVATAERLRRIADLAAAAHTEERVALVASAVSGVTDLLLDALRSAAAGQSTDAVASYRAIHAALAAELATDLGVERFRTLVRVLEAFAAELEERLRGVALLRDCSPRVEAHTVTLGERASCALLAALLAARGRPVLALDPLVVLPCSGDPLEATPRPDQMRERLAHVRAASDALSGEILLMPGFYGGGPQGEAMCLGRGGSDYSAALLAQALDARLLEIWTDVDGIYTTDPRIAPAARVLAALSFEEALELAHFGAKVLHPRTVAPARAAGIPVRICNTLRPEAPGTRVGDAADHVRCDEVARGISFLRGVALVNVFGPGMPGVPGVAARLFAALAQHAISVILITQGSSETAISLCVQEAEAEEAVAALRTAFEAEIALGRVEDVAVRRALAIVSLVGDGMRERAGVAGGFFGALGEADVNVAAIAQGASERSISAVVADADGERAVRVVHRRFFERARRLDLYVAGRGTVGGALLALLGRERSRLGERGVELHVRAVAGRSEWVEEPGSAREARGSAAGSGARRLLDRARAHGNGAAVLVDCAGTVEVADLYAEALRAGIHVVTASKLANSGDLASYRALHASARSGKARLRDSATVGAGLPILDALRRLLGTGDALRACTAVASGSLSLLCGALEDGVPFSTAVRAARERGYTEPDPRDDLSGRDVARKMLTLARAAGGAVEPEEVFIEPVLPAGWDARGTIEEFLARSSELDGWFAARFAAARAQGRTLRHVGEIEGVDAGRPRIRVGLAEVDDAHPLRRVRDGGNAFSLRTALQDAQPLVIAGPGAGGAATASALLADLLALLPEDA